jgi:NIMA (never in mitosis gene a)-related kinase
MGVSESLNYNQSNQIIEEEITQKINNELNEMNKLNFINQKQIKTYFNSFIKEKFRGDINDFYKIYKIKNNKNKKKEFIYDVYTVENKFTKTLYKLKIYTTDMSKFKDSDYFLEKNMLINDLITSQQVNSPLFEYLITTYFHIKNDTFSLMIINNYSTDYTLLDKMNEKIEKSQKFTSLEIDLIMRFLFDILDHMRNINLIHRGLTPSSIYFAEKDNYTTLMIKNYFFSAYETQLAKGLTGSLWYSAPEILKDSDQCCKVDIYSAGIIIYQSITLENPYQNIYKKEKLLENIEKNVIEKSFQRFIKINYESKYFDIILKMTDNNKYTRSSLDELISDKLVKEIRLKINKEILKDKNNLYFNMKMNYRILDNMINKLTKMNKDLLGLIYCWYYNFITIITDRKKYFIFNFLFDYFDSNKNNFIKSTEFRDKIFEYHFADQNNNENNKHESIRVYSNKYKTIFELLSQNSFYKSNDTQDSGQFDFQHFTTILLIFNFFDEKERRNLILNQNKLENTINSEKTFTKSNIKSISKSHTNDKDNIYGNFDINNVDCIQEDNYNKLYAVFNYYLKTDSFFEFRKLTNIETNNKFNHLEDILENYYQNIPLLIKSSNGINYISKTNFVKMMEFEFEGPTSNN